MQDRTKIRARVLHGVFFQGWRAWVRNGIAALALATGGFALAQDAAVPSADAAAVVKAGVEKWLRGRYPIESVRKAPMAGLWEVQIGSELFYVDDKGQYGVVGGQLLELKSNRNLTQERVDELLVVDFKALPLSLAIKQVLGKGTRPLVVFEDPNCGYCRALRRDLLKLTDVTLYTFTLPILSAESGQMVRQVWCAPDRAKAWNDLMMQRRVPDNKGTCDAPIEKIVELGRKLKITGTPTLVFASGKRVPGGVPAARLNELLAEHSTPL